MSRAVDALREAQGYFDREKPKRALVPVQVALDILEVGDPNDLESRQLLTQVVLLAQRVGIAIGRPDLLRDRRESLFRAGLHLGPLAESLIEEMAIKDKRTDLAALEQYVSYIEAHGRMDDALRTRLNQILSYGLHVRLSSPNDKVRPLLALLDRLHRSRPHLTFPRLYLGRLHYLDRNWALARELLGGLSGRMSEGPKVLNLRGRCAEKLGLFDEARALYRQSLTCNHHQPHIHFRLGRVLLLQIRRLTVQR